MFKVYGLWLRLSAVWFMVEGVGCRDQGVVYGVRLCGVCRVQGSGLGI